MESRRKPQLLVHLTLFSALFSQALAWPLFEAPVLRIPFEGANDLDQALLTLDTDILPSALVENDRSARHAEEVLTREYKRQFGQLPAKRNVESFMGNQDSNNIPEDNGTKKRDTNEKMTDRADQLEKQTALRNFFEKLRNESDEENPPDKD